MRPTPSPSAGLDPDRGLPVVPEVPPPLLDGGEDRLVTLTPAAVLVRPSPTLLAARQLLDEVDPHARRSPGHGDRLRLSRRQHALRGLVVERRALRDRGA